MLHAFLLGRAGRRFDRRERAYLNRVQPLLLRTTAHHRQLRRSRAASGGTDPATIGITPRELTVLTLLADGLTAAARIAPGTANKHRENLYRKLGTTDRVHRAAGAGVRHSHQWTANGNRIGAMPALNPLFLQSSGVLSAFRHSRKSPGLTPFLDS